MAAQLFPQVSHPKKRAFLMAYAQCGLLTEAAKCAGVDRRTHTNWKHGDAVYRDAFARAREMVADLHEDEASRRAMGWDEERIGEDGTPYTIRKYSDTLLIVRLKALKPEDYRENVKIETDVTVHLETALHTGVKRLELLRGPDSDRALPA